MPLTTLQWLAMAVPLALPGVGILLGMTVGRGSLVAGIAGSSLAGAAIGAYLGVDVGVGIVLAAVLFAWRSSRPVHVESIERMK